MVLSVDPPVLQWKSTRLTVSTFALGWTFETDFSIMLRFCLIYCYFLFFFVVSIIFRIGRAPAEQTQVKLKGWRRACVGFLRVDLRRWVWWLENDAQWQWTSTDTTCKIRQFQGFFLRHLQCTKYHHMIWNNNMCQPWIATGLSCFGI